MQQAASLVQDGAQLAGDAGAEVEDPQEPGAAIPRLAPCTHARTFSPHVFVWGTPSKVSEMLSSSDREPWQVHMASAVTTGMQKEAITKVLQEALERGGLTNSVCGSEQGEGAVDRLQGPEAVLLSGPAWEKSLVRGLHLLSACLCCQRIAAQRQ